jgi:hypothetical protein
MQVEAPFLQAASRMASALMIKVNIKLMSPYLIALLKNGKAPALKIQT